jgi:hypothetical protein
MFHAIIMQISCGGESLHKGDDKMATSGDDSKKQTSTAKRLPPNAGKGRKKGVPNKITASVKEMILAALDAVGGQRYLEDQAKQNPQAFMSLLGRIIPSEIRGEVTTVDKNFVVYIDTSDSETIPEPALTGRFGDL